MKRTAGSLLLILGFGLIVRMIYLLLNTGTPYFGAPVLDEFYYYQWANEIAGGDWLASATVFRPPTYSYLLAGILLLVQKDLFFVAEFLQHLGGILGAFLMFQLALRLFRSRTVALLSAFLALSYAPGLFFEGQLLDTWLQTILGPAVLLAAFAACRLNTGRSWFLLGLAGGVSAIVRPAALPFFVLLTFVSGFLVERSRAAGPRRVVLVALMWLGLVIPIVPMTVRNMAVSDSFVPVASYAGINFWVGNNAAADGFTSQTPERYESYSRYEDSVELYARRAAERMSGRRMTAREVQSFWFRTGLGEITASPARFLKLCFKKFVLFWSGIELRNNKSIYVVAEFHPLLRWLHVLFSFRLLAPFAIYGLFVVLQRKGMTSRLAVYLLYQLALMCGVLIFFVNTRYRFPAAYLMLPLSACGIVDAARMVIRRSARRRMWLRAGILFTAAAFVNIDFYGVGLSTRQAEDYWTVANCYKYKNMDDDALAFYRAAIVRDPNHSSAFNNAGEIYHRRGEYDMALSYFQKALESAGADSRGMSRAFSNLGVVFAARGETARALSYFGLAVKAVPENAIAWVGLGDSWREEQRLEDAYAAYDTAVRLDPLLPRAHVGLAHCWHLAGNQKEVLKSLRLAEAASRGGDIESLLRTEGELARYIPMLVE